MLSTLPSVRKQSLLKSRTQRLPWNFAEWFVLSQTLLPALLYLPGSQEFRVPIRVAGYGIALAALAYWWARWRHVRPHCAPHPAAPWLVVAIAYLLLMLLHPNTNSITSGLAQVTLYLAVLAPVFWAPKLVESPDRLRRLLWLLLICSGISSFVGVMQVRDPDRWMPLEFSSVYPRVSSALLPLPMRAQTDAPLFVHLGSATRREPRLAQVPLPCFLDWLSLYQVGPEA